MNGEKKKTSGMKIALIVLLAVVLLGAAGVGGWMLAQNGKDNDDSNSESRTERREKDEDEETDAADTPAPSEAPIPENLLLLGNMGYIGDTTACTMTADQARACAQRIRNTQGGVVMAAIFDGGNGVPIIWIAQADTKRSESDEQIVLTGHYQDKLYGFASGQLAAYDWMTTLLRAGTDGVMVKINRDSTKLQFYSLVNGAFASQPFGTGLWNHTGDATYNGVRIGSGSEVALWDFYRAAGDGYTVLLEAMSGDSENLYLIGNWMPGEEMSALLDQYAEVVS